MHWNRSDCPYPQFSDFQWELLVGLLMGDADLHGLSDPNPHFRLRMTNEPFLNALADRFGVLSKGVYLARDAKTQYETAKQNKEAGYEKFQTVNRERYSDLFGLRTCSHPALNEFRRWYDEGEKRYPKDLTLTPVVTRMWFVCDGWLAKEASASPRIMFKVSNERDRTEFLIDLFDSAGFDVGFSRDAIQVPYAETRRMLEWMGHPPAGFDYKWDLS
jgi:hypothetical protein